MADAGAQTGAQPVRPRPLLFVIQGPLLGSVFSVRQMSALIGRGGNVDVSLADDSVSREHARLTLEAGGVYLEDLASQNGTFVNGERITEPTQLLDGDRLRVGASTLIRFSLVDEIEERAMLTLFELTLHDPLTRLYNRRYFERRVHEEFSFARRQGTPLSVLLIDVDHFKRVNDSHGHPVGDMVLKRVARSIQKVLRPEDVLARYGGEEFIVIARSTSLPRAQVLGERIRLHVQGLVLELPSCTVRVTISVGVVGMGPEGGYPSCAALVVAADSALYRAKSGGRNRVCTTPSEAPGAMKKADSELREP